MLKTALTLTEDQLQRMVRYVRGRIEGIEEARSQGWMDDRERFEREWDDDFSFREGENAVFARSNESLNMIGAGVDYIRSRLIEEIFAQEPWFAAEPRQPETFDPALALRVRRHLLWKLGPDEIGFEAVAADVVTQACKLGECVVKLSYKTEEEGFERIASILWDETGDAPVLTQDGEFVFEEGPLEALAEALCAPLNFVAEWHPGDPVSPEALPPGFCWKEQIVSERRVRSAGAKAAPLHPKEFYCPLNAPSVHEADFVAHMTSMRLSDVCGHLGVSLDGGPEEGPDGDLRRALRQIRAAGGGEPQAESGQPLPGEAEEVPAPDADPEFRVVEAYFRFDARGDGRPCRVFLMVAYDYDVPIFWDYIANVTPEGCYPFEAVVVNKEPHRWYGRSWFQKFERYQHLIDKLTNQILYRNDLAANPVKFRRKEAVVQWQDDQPFEIEPDKVFDLNDGYSAEDALQTARIPELDEQTKFLLEMVISTWRMRAGVTTATQGAFGGMPNERTATGITQVAATGATLFRPQLMEIKRGLEAVLRQVVAYQYAYLETDETFPYLEGDVRRSGLLSWRSVRNLDLNVTLTLSLASMDENLDAAQMAVDFFGQFLAVPDAFKPVAAPLYARVMKQLQIPDADAYCRRVVEIAGGAASSLEPERPAGGEALA
ncbi:MAG: hypothetical protein PHQ12_05910 [Chthoniobacteraceae bacterium]|nr:hypothetical protein [Chthoniobacteraceae bacterium]